MKIAGIVLAGGLSTRMGQDKAQLMLAQQTLLSRSVTLLSQLNLTSVFVSGQYDGYTCIEDKATLAGPIAGLHASVETLINNIDALFIIPIDMPLLSETQCRQLLLQFERYPQGVFYDNAIFPMILPLTQQLAVYLSEAIASPHNKQRSLYRLLKTLKLQKITYKETDTFRFQNSNTPQEWQQCLVTYQSLYSAKE